MHIWDSISGYKRIPYSRYGYKIDDVGDYTTLYGQPCKLVKRWKKEDEEKGLIFESDVHPVMRYLVDTYLNDDTPPESHVIMNIDIEVSTNGGIPDIRKALNEITSIAYYNNATNEYTVNLLDPSMQIGDFSFVQRDIPVNIKSYSSEPELLDAFLTQYLKIKPTILTGWNIDNFDIPYLYNRISNIFGYQVANKLSYINRVEYNAYRQRYFIAGVSCLDMMSLYKNFTFGERQSYSLDSIAMAELGEGKIKYEGTLDKLYLQDKEKFIDYNVHDVRLVKMIDEKMKLIQLAKGICHKGHVPLEDVYFSSRYLDGAILVYLKRKGKFVVPNKPSRTTVKKGDETFSGAYVKEPIPGLYNWVVDLDATSMYPSIIMSLNISPETKITKILNWNNNDYQKDIDRKYEMILDKEIISFNKNDFKKFLDKENIGVSTNGVMYRLDKMGIIPEILTQWFDERTEMKNNVKKYGKEKNDDGTINMLYDRNKLEFYNTRQKIQKTLLNSLYGVLGLPNWRYYDLDNASAVTATGVNLIQFASKIINHYYSKQLGKYYKISYNDGTSIYKYYSELSTDEKKYLNIT